MSITAVLGLAITAAVLCVVLNQYKPEYRIFVGLAAGAIIVIAAFISAKPVIEEIQNLMSSFSDSETFFSVLLKTLGICYITQFAADACRDAGENGLASKAELAGKILITLTALPVFSELIKTVNNII